MDAPLDLLSKCAIGYAFWYWFRVTLLGYGLIDLLPWADAGLLCLASSVM